MGSIMDGSERYEQLMAFLGSQLPTPVEQQPGGDGSIIFTGGEPAEVMVHLTESAVVVSEYAGAWDAHGFIVKPRRVGLLKWRRLPESALMNALADLIKGAREIRLARYRTCRCCDEKNPPEWMLDDDVCHRCAEQQRDVVH